VSYWKTKPEAAGEQVRRIAEPLVAFIGRGEDEPPVRPHVFKIVDEHGVEREVYAPPGNVTRWPWP
jgi:hypothetical protein